ncbi:hypothetical protein AQI95_23925 [Streptomyces yokosukanensis]|uniref:Uncharacterized protein n=1 Tax=Streptomyces yokosukanensis TaxID=67386 RepID=A0A124HFD3_9ACTN|nr:hypothetical protein AQI95_23925 [Streptomyces yokosukanensis]
MPGREAQQLFIEFEAPFSGFMPEARDYTVQLQARVGHRKGWRRLLTFTLRAANIIDPSRYTRRKPSAPGAMSEAAGWDVPSAG